MFIQMYTEDCGGGGGLWSQKGIGVETLPPWAIDASQGQRSHNTTKAFINSKAGIMKYKLRALQKFHSHWISLSKY